MFKKTAELSKLTGCKVASLAFSSLMNSYICGYLRWSNFGDTNYMNDSFTNYEHVQDVKPLRAVPCTANEDYDGFFSAATEQHQRLATEIPTDNGIVKQEEVGDPDDKELRKLMTRISASDQEKEKVGDYDDYLLSTETELLIVDHADVMTMQNQDHVKSVVGESGNGTLMACRGTMDNQLS